MPPHTLAAHLAAATNRVGRRLTREERDAAEEQFNLAEPPPTIYTVADAAAHLGRAVSTIHDQAAKTGVGFESVGGTLLFTRADIDALRDYRPRPGPKVKTAGLAGEAVAQSARRKQPRT